MLNKYLCYMGVFLLSTISVFSQTARVQVIHNSALPAAAEVDVYINGEKPDALDNFAFRTATPFVDLPSGVEIEITVASSTSENVEDGVIGTFNLGMLAENGTYVVMANGILGEGFVNPESDRNIDFNLFVLPGLEASDDDNVIAMNIFHGSTDAPAVDVYIDDEVDPNIPDINYAQFTGYNIVLPQDYILTVTVAGDKDAVAGIFEAPLSGLGGDVATVFASGFLSPDAQPGDVPENYAFGIYAAFPDGTVIELPRSIQSVNNQSFKQEFEIFPTPANEFVYVTNNMTNIESIKVYDMNGQVISTTNAIQQDANTFVIETKGLSSGVYYLQINGLGYSQTEQIIIER